MLIGEALREAYKILKDENIESYMIDSQLLLSKVLNKDKVFIMVNREYELKEEEEKLFFKYISLRKNHMPVKYILNQCEFMGLNFYIKEGVLIPRPDTEILVEWVIDKIKEEKLIKVCDLCCGSGAIGVSIATYIKESTVDLYDISKDAIEVTEKNIRNFSLSNAKVHYSDLLETPIKENKTYDIFLSNPPYIEEKEIDALMSDVKNYEPHLALSGGEDGLYFYRNIIKDLYKVLNKGAYIGFEIGYNQGEAVGKLLDKEGFNNIEVLKDLSGLDRVVTAIYCEE